MTGFDFDERIDRRGTDCLKWDFAAERGKPADVLPMWVADMDIRTAPCVREALVKAADAGIYGYTNTKEDFAGVVCDWFKRRHGWECRPEWIVKTPGVVFALAAAVKAFTGEGDSVMIQQPVYYPFFSVIKNNGRRIVNSPLRYEKGHYEMDFEDMEEKLKRPEVKLFILCSPHNPVGRVWSADELERVLKLCKKYDVIVASDEIHCDFTYPGYRHRVFASLSGEAADISAVFTSPSKSFNLAGLQYSSVFIKNDSLRRRFQKEVYATGYDEPSLMGVVAARAAYTEGEGWLDALKEYLTGNLECMRAFLKERMPSVKLVEPEGTYLTWVDLRGLGEDDDRLCDLVLSRAKLWLDEGRIFGEEGKGFTRFNIACPRSLLTEALHRFEKII